MIWDLWNWNYFILRILLLALTVVHLNCLQYISSTRLYRSEACGSHNLFPQFLSSECLHQCLCYCQHWMLTLEWASCNSVLKLANNPQFSPWYSLFKVCRGSFRHTVGCDFVVDKNILGAPVFNNQDFGMTGSFWSL